MNILTIEKLRVDYGGLTALHITEKIEFLSGDRIGIIGNNGAGKTTFAKAVCGLTNYMGEIKTELRQSDIAIHLQENAFIKRMPVNIIIEAIFDTAIKTNTKLQEIIRFFDFEDCLKKRYAQLSGGQKQKLALICVLMQDKQLTFFDEVTSGLDFETRSKLMDKIQEWYKGKDNTVCVVSHYYDELEKFVNKLLIIDKGRVAAFGDVDALFKKYCGQIVYIIESNEQNERATKQFKRIIAPANRIAFRCVNAQEETKLTETLIKNNINFKRSDRDLEILFANAVAAGGGK